MNAELRLYVDRMGAKSTLKHLSKVIARALYVVDGSVAMRDGNSTSLTLGANSGVSAENLREIGAGSLAAVLLRWELVDSSMPLCFLNDESKLLLSSKMALDASRGYLLRCDRVDFPAGGEALTHTHQGGGTRCLLFGSIRIDTQGVSHTYGPLGAWFEAGPDPVYAAADLAHASAFVRVMVLPLELLGGLSSIKYERAEDRDKPKSQRYQIFIDEPIGRFE
jgi:hypothetical protein